LIADAYGGREIKQCVADFFKFSAGPSGETVKAISDELGERDKTGADRNLQCLIS
jgi:hypothetical protein